MGTAKTLIRQTGSPSIPPLQRMPISLAKPTRRIYLSLELPWHRCTPDLTARSDAYVAKLSPIPSLTVSPSPFDFGIQQLGVTGPAQAFVLTNNTSSTITFNSIVVTGVSPAANTDFAKSSDGCSPSVAAGLPCTVNVTFTPSVAAAESATLVITAVVMSGGQTSTETFDVNLTGTGSTAVPGITFKPTSVSFAGQMLTTTSAAIPLTLTSSGTGPLTINAIAGSGDFAQTNNCPVAPATLAAAATCTINVTFAPTAVGARTGTLTVMDNANGSPHTIPLTGNGWDFQVTAPSSETGKSPSQLQCDHDATRRIQSKCGVHLHGSTYGHNLQGSNTGHGYGRKERHSRFQWH